MSKPAPTSPTPRKKVASGFSWAGGQLDARPVYRVVEMVREPDGRLRRQGSIWHVDLDVPRKFGRALAANTSSHRILIEDNEGRVLEEVPVVSAGSRQPSWAHWEDIPLPRLPPRGPAPRRLPVLEAPSPDKQDDDCDVNL